MTDEQTLAVYDAKVDDYKELTVSQPPRALVDFIADVQTGGHVLDLGCGPGFAAAEMARQGLVVTATDASIEMVKTAASHPGVTARQETFDDLPDCPTYDGIYANFSLLHAARDAVPGYLAAIRTALKPGGVFHIGMKVGDGEERDAIGRRYAYFQVDELRGLIESNGMTVVWTAEGTEKGMAGTMDPFVLMRAHG